MVEAIFVFLALFYASLIIFFYIGILREQKRSSPVTVWQPFVSILVPARNEEANIEKTLQSLARQNYPQDRHEILVIDDHSTDRTGEVVREYIAAHQLSQIKLIRHERNGEEPTYKKTAIVFALASARGDLIMTTDADCRVQPDWVSTTVGCYDDATGMVAGLITFDPDMESTAFHKLQTLEFAGLVFAGVGAIGNNYPIICNGSNLSYRRAAYDEVGGFAGHEQIPSGDDDLFMQNLHKNTEWIVRYNLAAKATNFTRPVDTLKSFLNQRSRWASKSTHYPDLRTFLLLLLIYVFYLLLLILIPVTLYGGFSWIFLLTGLLLKIIPEYLVVRKAVRILNRKSLMRFFIIAQIVQIPYIVTAGVRGFFQIFSWKRE